MATDSSARNLEWTDSRQNSLRASAVASGVRSRNLDSLYPWFDNEPMSAAWDEWQRLRKDPDANSFPRSKRRL